MRKDPPLVISKGEWSKLSVYPLKKREGHVGIAIPRSLFPQSTLRNRLRRQIREAVRLLKKEKGAILEEKMTGREFVIRVQKKTLPPFKLVRKEIEEHLEQLETLP